MDSRQAFAYTLLPDRQAHYEACLQTLATRTATGNPRAINGAQQVVRTALRTLNLTRVAAGLAEIEVPVMKPACSLFEAAYAAQQRGILH
jgi:hypothetical protein